MYGILEDFLESIRPSFWQGDYNFLWIYLVLLIISVKLVQNLYDYYYTKTTFASSRVDQHRISMQEAWRKRQELLESSTSTEPLRKPKDPVPVTIKENKQEDIEEKKEETKDQSKKKNEKPKKTDENLEEIDENLARAQRKRDYFNDEKKGGSSYKPNLRDRYPGVYKRTGG